MNDAPRKIAILGGGISSLSAAFDLTSERNWKKKYDITVYQLGWRLGGKGASSRNPDRNNRIEEHGLHIWLGFYENAFAMMRTCYGKLANRKGIFPSWTDAFKPHEYIVLQENTPQGWISWPYNFPVNDSLPGSGFEIPTLWDYLVMALQWIRDAIEPKPIIAPEPTLDVAVNAASEAVMRKELSTKERSSPRIGLKLARAAARHSRGMSRNPQRHSRQDQANLVSLLSDMTKLMHTQRASDTLSDVDARRTWITIDLFAAVIRGVLNDDVLTRGLDPLDKVDFRDWLTTHGAAEETITSPLIRGGYDLAFSFESGDPSKMNLAAGVGLRALFRMVFTYKGAPLWKMQAGMGETVFTPLYLLLRDRGVKFAFFHRVDAIEPSADGQSIERIQIIRQATCRRNEYEPLVRVNELDCWHFGPDFAQLEEAEQLQKQSVNLESYWTQWPGVGTVTLQQGNDFDTVILGIPIEGLKTICKDLILASPKWQQMTNNIKTIQTQGFQLWLNKDLTECGWKLPSPILGAYVEPIDTWADMSHLLPVESWPATSAPKQLAYLVGVMQTRDDLPMQTDSTFPAGEEERCKNKAIEFLKTDARGLWPKLAPGSPVPQFDWSCLVSAPDATGVGRLAAQYWHANIDPSERYTLALAGTTDSRLAADKSGFSNLILTGDWIRNGFNSPGCIESAVLSGRQAARAITGSKQRFIGEDDLAGSKDILAWILRQLQNLWDLITIAIDKLTH